MNKEVILEYIEQLEGNYEKLSAMGMYSNGALDALFAIKSFINNLSNIHHHKRYN